MSEVKQIFDRLQPTGILSLANMRNTLMALHQMDLLPLRPSAKRILDEMEYSTDGAAAAAYSGTGVTITKEGTIKQEGNFSLKAVTDGTSNREFETDLVIDLSAFSKIYLWERSSQAADTIQFFVEDSSGDRSHWDITTDGSAGTWQQDELTLASPDGNNGTDADLSDIVKYGFQALTASKTYYFDTIFARTGLAVAVSTTNIGEYFKQVYLSNEPLEIDDSSSPAITPPSANPRVDILVINKAGTLSWVVGTEDSTPVADWASVPTGSTPICLVYCRTTMTEVVEFHERASFTSDGYILADVRPFLQKGFAMLKGTDVASASSITLPDDGNFFDITGTTTINTIAAKQAGTVVWLQFDTTVTVDDGGGNLKLNGDLSATAETVLQLVCDGTNWFEVSRNKTADSFLTLSDTPSSFSGQALKYIRVDVGAAALEFIVPSFLHMSDTPASFSGQGSKFVKVNSGATALEFVAGEIKSNVFFEYHGHIDSGVASFETWGEVSELTEDMEADNKYRFLAINNATNTFRTIYRSRFTKIAGVNTIKAHFYARKSSGGTDNGQIRCSVGGNTGDVTLSSSSWGWIIATVDVSGLTPGTSYDVLVQIRATVSPYGDDYGVAHIVGIGE